MIALVALILFVLIKICAVVVLAPQGFLTVDDLSESDGGSHLEIMSPDRTHHDFGKDVDSGQNNRDRVGINSDAPYDDGNDVLDGDVGNSLRSLGLAITDDTTENNDGSLSHSLV